MKKIISLFMIVLLLNTTIVFADSNIIAEGKCGKNLTWILYKDGELDIDVTSQTKISIENKQLTSNYDEENEIEAALNYTDMYNYDIGEAPWYEYREKIEKVFVGEYITYLGNYAFYDCYNITRIGIRSDWLTEIGYDCFKNCISLENINISERVRIIGSSAFENCKNLEDIVIPSNLIKIYPFTFANCYSLKSVVNKTEINSIDTGAFTNCLSLIGFVIPKSVLSIGSRAFYGCSNLAEITYVGSKSDWNDIDINASNNDVFNKCNITFMEEEILFEEPEPEDEFQYINLECPHCSKNFKITEDEYNGSDNVICPDCMKFIVYKGQDIEYECFGCGKVFCHSETKVVENGKIYCPYCSEIVDGDNAETETECYICGEYFDADNMLHGEDDNLICQECYDELQNEDEELTYIECSYCEETFEDNEDIYDKDGYAICPYCDEYIDDIEENTDETEIEFATSDWATEEVYEAYQNNLIPDEMLEDTLYDTITREEFAAISVKLYENIVGEAPYVGIDNMPFTDCDYESEYISYIAIAYELGITKGTSETTFSPYNNISREQLATMLYRVIKLAENNETYDFDVNNVRKFYDDSKISDYAKESVYFMAECGIVKGVDGTRFAPLDTATKEQSILISVRCVNNLL